MLTLLLLTALPTLPNYQEWTATPPRQLEFRVDDRVKAIVGFATDYRDPQQPGQFLRIYRRHVAILSERPVEQAADPAKGTSTLTENAAQASHVQEEKKALIQAQQASDIFATVLWKTRKDPQTGQDLLDGPVQYALMDPTGEWSSITSASLGELTESPVTEPLRVPGATVTNPATYDLHRSVIVGIIFTLKEQSHVLRIDQGILAQPKQRKEGTHAR